MNVTASPNPRSDGPRRDVPTEHEQTAHDEQAAHDEQGAPPGTRATLFARLTPGSERNLADTLRGERAGGVLLLVGAVVALVWANAWPAAYATLSHTVVGPSALHLDLTLAQWATDGLLTVFFFVVGLELARELTVGELRHPATAVVPIVAAVGGMVAPALLYLALNVGRTGGATQGWAVPTATDIAFAVAVLALVGRGLPPALRAFLLTLAVVDDLLAILVIGTVYTEDLAWLPLLGSVVCVAAFAWLVRRRRASAWLLVPLGVVAWAALHASGVHATLAGVALGLVVPASPEATARARGLASPPEQSLAEEWEHRWRPWSAGLAVPVFALFAAGVTVSADVLADALADPVAQGVALGLVVGKPLGILAATWAVATFTRARLALGLGWGDVIGVGLVGGIGFTVSLLVAELAFGDGSPHDEHAVLAVLVASLLAALTGGTVLAARGRRRLRSDPAGAASDHPVPDEPDGSRRPHPSPPNG
ncbi:Na(+)/H(+) antiporter NhaA OS=Cellulomonas persica OX=76861 GN=nhaA PE=3 SV=1 [Cellulomonas persica]|uniref:Na(+)/H(+) antiporter NhaA n=1 Tax=Cellulomonas persica TaxID=76861 RepID=A0A510UWP9_9CELL|nr:Na(+)/H(+) antiporter NhaA [Cellulomonas persica]